MQLFMLKMSCIGLMDFPTILRKITMSNPYILMLWKKGWLI